MRFLPLIFIFYSSILLADSDHSDFLYGNDCKALSWKADRESSSRVSIQGSLNKPNHLFNVEVWNYDKLIGTALSSSNARGVFLVNVYTIERAPKYPRIVIVCR